MKVRDYAQGIYTLINEPIIAQIKVHDYEDYYNQNPVNWKPCVIKKVMLRATKKTGYYIIKYDNDNRCDVINDFKVNGKSLKSYLIAIGDNS